MNVISPASKRDQQLAPIGWEGRTLAEMLEESERVFAETGRYWDTQRLSIKLDDPIEYEKIWSRLRGGLVTARETAANISASVIVRELGELCFGLYTPEGDSIALSTGIMAHIHTMSMAIKHMARSEYEDNPGIEDGDIFVNNDPQLGDVHNADVQEFVPIFWEGELIGWAAGVTHEIDVGSPQPSGMPVGTVNRYEDGFILSCEKVGRDDRLNKDYERRSESATRMPFYWVLDEKCRISGCQMIRGTVLHLIQEIGIGAYKTFIREVIEDTRRNFVDKIKETLVPGTYRMPSFMDVPHSGDKGRMPDYAAVDSMMNCPLELRIDGGGSFDLDLDGANKWGYHSFNCTPSGLQGGLWVALCQTLVPNEKVNDGAYLATSFNTPYGSWADPDNLSVSNTIAWAFLQPCFTGLLHSLSRGFAARGFLEEVLAAYPFTGNITQGGGVNHYGHDGSWTNFEISSCGISARWAADGETACAAMWNPEGDLGDVEAWELMEPALYLGRNVRPNTGGLGKRRGGSGYESIRMIYGTSDQLMYNGGNGHVFMTCGLFGGYPGSSGYRHSIKGTDMAARFEAGELYPTRDQDPADSGIETLSEGETLRDRRSWHFPDPHKEHDIYLAILNGGHGVGDLMEREPQSVVDDLNGDFVLPRFADAHGVVATQDDEGNWAADLDATDARRSELRNERLARSQSVDEWKASQRDRVASLDFIHPVRKMHQESCELSENWNKRFKDFWDLPDDWTA
jgi:N-methylhydantoinase B/oxoprolinase/acetone carboxylase alpha subunit